MEQLEMFDFECPFCIDGNAIAYISRGYYATGGRCGEYPCKPMQEQMMMLADRGVVKTVYMGDK